MSTECIGYRVHWVQSALSTEHVLTMHVEKTHLLLLFRRLGIGFHLIRVKVSTTGLVRWTSQVSKGLL